jgi:phospholipid/cholesterol/gamma-HCH transport system substrate-binding protein
MRRLVGVALATSLVLAACGVLRGEEPRTYRAVFSRAVQLFPGGGVRVLGVDVGEITEVRNRRDGVEVTFVVADPDVRLPADVEAAIVPVSLLGERYVQLLPAYTGGPVLEENAVIPMERTAVPAEPDELLASLQDYLGAIDPDAVSEFVENAAAILDGTGQQLNDLLRHSANVIGTLSDKRDDLTTIIVEFERLSQALSTRQAAIERLIHSYNAVVGTLTSNRASLEGTITGLNAAASELASLLIAHRSPLGQDIRSLTRTGRTLSRNIETLAGTGHWAERLFRAASRAVDYDADWLRLNNQNEPLAGLIVARLEQRLMELCSDLGLPTCSTPAYWSKHAPSLFCFAERCPTERKKADQSIPEQVAGAIAEVPDLANELLQKFRDIDCKASDDYASCIKRKRILVECAKSDHPKRCLREHAAELECVAADNVAACVKSQQKAGLTDLVTGILEETLNPDNVLPGGLR